MYKETKDMVLGDLIDILMIMDSKRFANPTVRKPVPMFYGTKRLKAIYEKYNIEHLDKLSKQQLEQEKILIYEGFINKKPLERDDTKKRRYE